MPAPVVIDVGVAEPRRELATALVDACSQAATVTDCRLLRDAPNGPYTAIAIVTWEEGDKARVEVGVRRDPVSEWRTRELTFQPADADVERYRSVGFVIGSLATSAHDEDTPRTTPKSGEQPSKPASRPETPPAETSSKPAPAPDSGTRPKAVVVEPPAPESPPSGGSSGPARGWIGLNGTIGSALDRGGPRYGGRFGAGVRIIPSLAAIASLGASIRPRDDKGVVADWLDAGGGLNLAILPPASHHLELRAEVLAERFSAEARSNGDNAGNHRTTAAFRVGADGVLVLVGPLAAVVGGEVKFGSATIVHVDGKNAGATRYVEIGAAAGLRLEL